MIGLSLLALAAAAVEPAQGCAAARAALPQVAACAETAGGIALAADEATARTLLDQARPGEQRFRAAFGREPARYALFYLEDPATAGPMSAALRRLGYVAVLALPSPAFLERQLVAVPPPGGGAWPTAREIRSAAAAGEPVGPNFVPHEIGHLWYWIAFWRVPAAPASTQASNGAPAPARRYGSPAPDWLDEAAAMMMEDETGTRGYHRQFAAGREGETSNNPVPPEIPLATLTSMTHPALASLPAAGAPGEVIVANAPASLFYPEVRVFVDYLIERSGDPRIIASISERLQGGVTLDAWLASDGGRHRLPASLAAMQEDWDAWLDRRFGPARDRR